LLVASVLKEKGDAGFLQAEGDVLKSLQPKDVENTVLSLSGSNALHDEAMRHVRDKLGSTVVYLDAKADDIVARCERMKVDRIVGQASMPLRTVIENRLQTYERQFDVRVAVDANETPDVVAQRVITAVDRSNSTYLSTRGSTGHSFEETVRADDCVCRQRSALHCRYVLHWPTMVGCIGPKQDCRK
jgi:shikimate kinase